MNAREAGFALTELIVVVAMIGVLSVLAAPQFMSAWRASATSAAASELATAINRGRQLAISANQSYCVKVFGTGVQYLKNSNATCTSSDAVWTGTGTAASGLISLSNNMGVSGGPVVFTSLGAASLAGKFTVTNPNDGRTRDVVVAGSGRVTVPPVTVP